jgi:hypothetical protein
MSQKNKNDTTHYKSFPIPIVKKITQDLLRLDSCQENLKKTNEELVEVYKKVSFKDSIINDMVTKEGNYKTIIDKERIKNELFDKRTKKLELDLKVQKIKGKLSTFISGGFVAVLTTVLILKK